MTPEGLDEGVEQHEQRPPDEWRFALGAQLETAPHGVVDVGWRRGPLSVQLFTDTLDLRAGHAFSRGRIEAGLRGAAFAAGMSMDPWLEGAPDRTRAQRVAYAGPDVHLERWLPRGTYLAVEGSARWHVFTPLRESALEVPDQGWLRLDAIAGGWWGDGQLQTRIAAGFDQTTEDLLAGRLGFELLAHPDGSVAPIGEWRAQVAQDQDDVIATRIGGMTPYAVPLAGAAWAEFWVEDFVAARAGVRVRRDIVSAAVVLDAAAWTWPALSAVTEQAGGRYGAAGVGVLSRIEREGFFGELSVGRATVRRPEGVFPVSVWVIAGSSWRSLEPKPRGDVP